MAKAIARFMRAEHLKKGRKNMAIDKVRAYFAQFGMEERI